MFAGFMKPQDRVELVSVPAEFFTEVLPTITNMSELKVTLHTFHLLSRKRGFPRGVSYAELRADERLLAGLKGAGATANPRPAEELLIEGLELAVARATLICLTIKLPAIGMRHEAEGVSEEVEASNPSAEPSTPNLEPLLVKVEQARSGAFAVGSRRGKTRKEICYMVNTPWNRDVVQQWKGGEIDLAGIDLGLAAAYEAAAKPKRGRVEVLRPNIFTLYEQNIGVLTPLLAEQLAEAQRTYPADWIEAAFTEAVSYNKRSWRYIERILQKWQVEGKGDGQSGRRAEAELDPRDFTTGKYAHIFQRGEPTS